MAAKQTTYKVEVTVSIAGKQGYETLNVVDTKQERCVHDVDALRDELTEVIGMTERQAGRELTAFYSGVAKAQEELAS